MKSNVCKIENGIQDLDAILRESEKVAVYNELNHKQTLQLRLICEEIDGMLPKIIDEFDGDFWIDFEDGVCKVNVSIIFAEFSVDKKKELITEFCIAYCGILSRHNICSTAITGKYISEATGLQIEKMLSGSHGGIEQIASKIAYDEVDVLILLRDTNNDAEYTETELNLVKLCDKYTVPLATNIATAEVLILALDRGDLDWRANLRNGAKAF